MTSQQAITATSPKETWNYFEEGYAEIRDDDKNKRLENDVPLTEGSGDLFLKCLMSLHYRYLEHTV